MTDSPLVQIMIKGSPVAIIDGKVYGIIIGVPSPTTWIATAADRGTIQFADQASGFVLSVPGTDAGTQAIAAPPGQSTACSAWTVTQYSDASGDDATQITDIAGLTSGYYTLEAPGTGEFLFRNRIEDYSIAPKRVALQEAGGQYELIIQRVG